MQLMLADARAAASRYAGSDEHVRVFRGQMRVLFEQAAQFEAAALQGKAKGSRGKGKAATAVVPAATAPASAAAGWVVDSGCGGSGGSALVPLPPLVPPASVGARKKKRIPNTGAEPALKHARGCARGSARGGAHGGARGGAM
jgi:hypothetical protein